MSAPRILLQTGDIPCGVNLRQAEAAGKDWRIYVDMPRFHGWHLYGKPLLSCRMFTDGSLDFLHSFAHQLGLHMHEFVAVGGIPRYDISEGTRRGAILLGAKNLQTEMDEQIAYTKARTRR